MNSQAALRLRRKRELIARSHAQRTAFTRQLRPLGHMLTTLDAGVRIGGRIRRHPGWLAAAAIGLMMIRPRRLSSLLRFAGKGLRTWRQLSPLLRQLPAPAPGAG